MPTNFSLSNQFPFSLSDYASVLKNEQYWYQRAKHLSEHSVLKNIEISDTGVVVHTDTFVPSDGLPDLIKGFKPDGLTISRNEKWVLSEKNYTNHFTAIIDNTPATLSGTTEVTPTTAGGTQFEIRGQAEVKIPLLGKKVEQGIIDSIGKLLEKEREFTLSWLAHHKK